jgi:hypothetical protein
MSEQKESIGCRVQKDWVAEIDTLAAEMGFSRSEWLSATIGEALGKTNVGTVRSLEQRLHAVERKLSRLAVLATQN